MLCSQATMHIPYATYLLIEGDVCNDVLCYTYKYKVESAHCVRGENKRRSDNKQPESGLSGGMF